MAEHGWRTSHPCREISRSLESGGHQQHRRDSQTETGKGIASGTRKEKYDSRTKEEKAAWNTKREDRTANRTVEEKKAEKAKCTARNVQLTKEEEKKKAASDKIPATVNMRNYRLKQAAKFSPGPHTLEAVPPTVISKGVYIMVCGRNSGEEDDISFAKARAGNETVLRKYIDDFITPSGIPFLGTKKSFGIAAKPGPRCLGYLSCIGVVYRISFPKANLIMSRQMLNSVHWSALT